MTMILLGMLVVLVSVLVWRGHFRKFVAPEKLRWYDFLVLPALLFAIEAVNEWVFPLGGLGHAAAFLGSGLYAVEVVDARPVPKKPKS